MPRKPRMTPEERRVKRAERKIAAEETAAKFAAEHPNGDPDAVPIRAHVNKIFRSDPQKYPAKLRLAIEYYLDTWPRDRKRAAERANMDPIEFSIHLASPGVIEYIHIQEERIDDYVAERRASARVLSEDYLDANTVRILQDPKAPHSAQARMIEVGYRRFGMLKDKVEATGAGGAPLAFSLVRLTGKKDSDDASS